MLDNTPNWNYLINFMNNCPVHTLIVVKPNILIVQLYNKKHDKYIPMGFNIFIATITNYLNKDPYDIVSVLNLSNRIVRNEIRTSKLY